MVRPWAVLAALPVLVLAGCSGPAAPDAGQPGLPAADGPATAVVLPWTTTDCRFMVVFLRASAAAVQSQLPEGFTAAGSATLPTGSVGFEIHDCASVQGLDGLVPGAGYGASWGVVTPPDGRAAPDAGGVAYFKWHVLVPDAPRRDLLVAHGVPAEGGVAEVAQTAPGAWSGRLQLDGVGAFTATLAAPAPEGNAGDLPFQEFTNATGGVADWRATTTHYTQTQGAGTWEAPAGSVLARMVGATSGAAAITTGVWSYEGGTIALP
jgi:hypothetical protein